VVVVTQQPFNGPSALLADEQENLRDTPRAELERLAAEPATDPFGRGERWTSVRAQAAIGELERRARR
jgi:hypothetical protein